MKLISFRIQNFKSIIDTGWCNLPADGITCLIGQNESGKSSILEALNCFHLRKMDEDFVRNDMSIPSVSCVFESNESEVINMFDKYKDADGYTELISALKSLNWRFTKTSRSKQDDLTSFVLIDFNKEIETIVLANIIDKKSIEYIELSEDERREFEYKKSLNWSGFLIAWNKKQPKFVLFNDESNLLPNEIDLESIIDEDEEPEGKQAVLNLLSIANIDIEKLRNSNTRAIKQYIAISNKNITIKLQDFWTQKIGKDNKISIEIELKNKDTSKKDKAGEPYLQFWIKDDEHTLHPKQRSKGVRWFLSFYLSLKADSLIETDTKSIFLIDEPGSNLHARAQEDVLRVLDDIRKSNQIIYTTHSQHLVEFNNIYRLLAVQRKDESDDESDTVVIPAYHLGNASTNTLAPVLEHMGIDFSNQNAISKNKNIILEEISAAYYFKAFSKLFKREEYHYLSATGVTNIEQLALLFLGWGLKFGVVMDDDSAGRREYAKILKTIYQGNDTIAKQNMYRIKKCEGIEDLFSEYDFLTHLVKKEKPQKTEAKSNSDLAKALKISKPMTSFDFYINVRDNNFLLSNLSDESITNITAVMDAIDALIENQK